MQHWLWRECIFSTILEFTLQVRVFILSLLIQPKKGYQDYYIAVSYILIM